MSDLLRECVNFFGKLFRFSGKLLQNIVYLCSRKEGVKVWMIIVKKIKKQVIMKRISFLLPVLAALVMGFFATSCEPDYVIEGSHTRVMTATVYHDKWQVYEDVSGTRYLYKSFEWDALSENMLKYGTVVAYVYDGTNQCPLPHVIPISYTVNGNVEVVPENIRFDIGVGTITFIMQDLDGFLPEDIADDLVFRAVATIPQQYVLE